MRLLSPGMLSIALIPNRIVNAVTVKRLKRRLYHVKK